MASSTEKVLKASDLKVKGSDSSSSTLVTRSRRSSASPSTFKKGSISKSASGSTVHDSAVPLPAANVPASVFSTVKTSSGAAQSRDPSKASRRGRRRSSGGELVSKTAPSYAVREGSRLLESPYGQGLSYEKSPRRRSLLSASLQSLSAGPVVSPSPQVSTLVSSPSPDLGDVPAISSSPLVDDNEITHSEHQDQGGSRDNQSGEPQGREPQQLRGIDTNNVSTSNPPTSSLPHPTFTSVLSGNISLMTNPLYPIISSSESSPSPPPSAPHIDGFNIPAVGINLPNAPSDMSPTSEEEIIPLESAAVFLQKRKAAAATQRQKGIGAGDPNSAASQAILKRRTQVLSTVQKARTRLSVLTYEVARKRRSFKNNCFGRFRRWLYERERKKMMGKGVLVNRLWLASLKDMEVSYGSPMMVAFSFIRWVVLLNAFLAVLWVCLIIIPFLAHPPKTFSWKLFWTTLGDKKAVKETFQAASKLRRGIRMQLKEMLADVTHREKTSSFRNRLMSAKVVLCSKLMVSRESH